MTLAKERWNVSALLMSYERASLDPAVLTEHGV
jgi:hypothetical protein